MSKLDDLQWQNNKISNELNNLERYYNPSSSQCYSIEEIALLKNFREDLIQLKREKLFKIQKSLEAIETLLQTES